MLILPFMHQSTICGTPVRPRAPPKAEPSHLRPETSWNGRVDVHPDDLVSADHFGALDHVQADAA